MRRAIVLLLLWLAAGRVPAEQITTTPLQFYGLGTLTCAAWSPDGTQIVTGGSAGAFLWDVATSRVVRMFIGHQKEVVAVAISPDGSKVLTGSADMTARLWNTGDGTTIRTFTGYNGRPNSLAFTLIGTKVLLAESDQTARLRNIGDGSIARAFSGHTSDVLCATLSADGTKVATGGRDSKAKIWDPVSGALIRTLDCPNPVERIALSPDGSKALTWVGQATRQAKLWDANTGVSIWTMSWQWGVYSLAFSSDGLQVAMGDGRGFVVIRDAVAGSVARELFAGSAPVLSVGYSLDGTRILAAVATPENIPRIWAEPELPFDRIFTYETTVISVAYSPDGTKLLTGGGFAAKLWDVADGTVIRTFFDPTGTVTSVAFSPDGTKVLTGSWDHTAKLWNAADGSVIRTFSWHDMPVNSVAFSPDGTKVLTGSNDSVAGLWDASNGSLVRTLGGHASGVLSVAFSPDGTKVLTGSYDDTAKLWNVSDGTLLHTFSGHAGDVKSAAFSPDGTKVLTGSGDKTAKLWDAANGSLLRTFSGHTEGLTSVAFSPDGRKVLTGSWDYTAKLWDTSNGTLLRTFSGHTGSVCSVAFSPDGRKVLTGSVDRTARLWHLIAGGSILIGHIADFTPVAISDNATSVATGHDDNTVRLWDAVNGRALRAFSGHSGPVRCVALFSTGTLLLSGGNDATARLWNGATGQVIRTFSGHLGPINSVAFSSDATRALTASDDGDAVLWNVANGAVLQGFSGHSGAVRAAAISQDAGRVLTGGADATAKLWNAGTGALLRTFSGHTTTVCSVALSHDGSTLLTGSGDTTAKLWNANTGSLLRTFTGHTSPVLSVGFSPDGNQIMTAGDTTTKIWKTADGTLLETIQHGQPLTGAAVSGDGTRLVTGGEDAMARLWSAFGGGGGPTSPTLSGDKFIIVSGGGNFIGNPIVGQTQALADRAFFTCLVRGYKRDEIRYLSAFNDWATRDSNGDGLPDADVQATTQTFWSAIDTWSSDTARLFVYLVDHGSYNPATSQWYFRLNATTYISAHDLDAHLDALQAATGCEVILIVDACYSGGFVQECTATSGTRRVVIGSTTPTNLSIYTPPAGAESFSFFFFSFAILGNTIANCYDWTALAFQAMGNPAGQDPWMDDNNNGVSDKWDGALAARHVLGRYPAFGLNAPTITAVASTQTVAIGDRVMLWARLDEAVAPREVWALVVPEGAGYTPGQPVTTLTRVDLASSPTANRWEARFTPGRRHRGRCTVIYFALSEDALHTRLLATPFASALNVTGDAYEVDDVATSATEYMFSSAPEFPETQRHNFHDAGDVDWVKLYCVENQPSSLFVEDVGSSCDAVIELYASPTAPMWMARADRKGPGQAEQLTCTTFPVTGVYYWKVYHATPTVFGDGTSYTVRLTNDTGPNNGLAIALGSRAIRCSWDPGLVAGDQGYNLYRRTVTGDWSKVNGSPLSAITYDDTGLEPSTEYFYHVRIKKADASEPVWTWIFFTVTPAETGRTVRFETAVSSTTESVRSVSLRLQLSAPSSATVTVNYSVSGTATPGGVDYSTLPGTIAFNPNTTQTSILVAITNDATPEPPDETVIVTLMSATGANLGTITTHTLTIHDNDTSSTAIRRWPSYR